MKSYLLIVGVLIVVISALITLNVFFQQSLQMEMAEQFNKQQLLLSSSIADNVKSYIKFLKEEAAELAHEFQGNDALTKSGFEHLIKEELRHEGLYNVKIGLLNEKGDILFVRGDEWLIRPVAAEIAEKCQIIKQGNAGVFGTTSSVVIAAPIYKQNQQKYIIVFFASISEIANDFVGKIKAGGKGYLWIMDKSGTLLYHPTQPDMIGGNIYTTNSKCFKCHINFDLEKRIIEGTTTNYGRHIAPSGEDKIIAFSNADVDELSWIIAVSAPYSEITGTTKKSMELYSYLILSIFATTSLISAVLIVFNKKRIKAEAVAKRKEELERYAVQLQDRVNERTAELVNEKEKLHTIVSAIGGGILLIDRQGRIQWSNEKIKEMAGMDVIGKTCEEICVDCNVSGEYNQDSINTIILSNLFNQKDKYFQVTTAPVRREDGEIHGYIRLVQDVTEMKKMEEQIIHAEKLASIGRLAAGIAHEIGNPLTSIFSFVQILREIEEDSFKRESLETIYFHIHRISEILKQLSGFSKMPAGEMKECQINGLIDSSIKLIQYDKKAKDIEVVKELSPSLPNIIADGNQLSQVFVNLVLNAIDAMPDGGRLTVRSMLLDGNIVVQVEDTGIGIPREELPKIFDPFYTTKEKGTGLGLAVSYNIIKKMNGTLTAESEAGKGTTFTITLPTNNR